MNAGEFLAKAAYIFVGLLLLVFFVLMVFRLINPIYFWAVAIFSAIMAYMVLPKLKR